MSEMKPEIRFEEFEDEWKTRKLGDISNITKLAGFEFTKYVEYSNVGNIPAVRGLNIKNEKFDFSEVKYIDNSDFSMLDRSRLSPGDILYTYVGTVGQGAVVPNNVLWYLAPNVARIRPDNSINSFFLLYHLINEKFKTNELKKWMAKTSQNSLSMGNIRKFEIFIPEKNEQKRIGHFSKKINKEIELKQKELDKLNQFKQAMLQKMFPKEGETVPEIRFEGYEDEWKQFNFMDILNKIVDFRGRTPKKLGESWTEGNYMALSALNVKKGYIDYAVDPHFGDKSLYKKWMEGNELQKGQVLLTTEAPVGNVAQVPKDNSFILSQRTISFIVNKNIIIDDFLFVLLSSDIIRNQLLKLSSGGTAKGISQKSLKKLEVLIPKTLEEQQKISKTLKIINQKLILKQKELDKLNHLKQAMLDKMFV